MTGGQLEIDLKCLNTRSHEELITIWRRHLPVTVPEHLPKALLARLLSYRLQEEQFGGMNKNTKSYLARLEADLRAGREAEAPATAKKQMMPGTLMVREHEGVMHRVMVLDCGFAWDGRTFQSLSAVAKAITGTNWNGHRFFGLKTAGEAAA